MTRTLLSRRVLVVTALPLLCLDVTTDMPPRVTFGREAAAIVGAPLTPFSAAGVARRTTRRVIAADTAATTAAAQPAPAAQATPAPAVTLAPAAGTPAVGSVAATLPAGCTGVRAAGVEYQLCDGAYYRAAFQGDSLVYVVVPQP